MNSKFGWLFFLGGIIAVGFLLKPFLTAIAFAGVVAFLWHPAHFKLRKKISETGSAALLTIATALTVTFLAASGAKVILSEFGKIYLFFSKLNIAEMLLDYPEVAQTINDVTRFFLSKIIAGLSEFASQFPHIILSMLVFFITLFFFIKDGERIANWVKRNAPISQQKKERIFRDLNNYAHAFINVWLLIAILQAIVATIGFYLFGLSYALLAGVVTAALSVIPLVGPYALYVPVSILLILKGNVAGGIGLLAYGLIFSGILDYGLRPYLASKWSTVHPLIILLGIFGGMAALGPAGFIIGPMLLMIVVTFFKDSGFVKTLK